MDEAWVTFFGDVMHVRVFLQYSLGDFNQWFWFMGRSVRNHFPAVFDYSGVAPWHPWHCLSFLLRAIAKVSFEGPNNIRQKQEVCLIFFKYCSQCVDGPLVGA